MPKILVIPGSLRAASYNGRLAALASKELTLADADLLTSSLLVADTLSVFGEGATAGAVYSPVASTFPQGAPAPAQELPRTFQVTC